MNDRLYRSPDDRVLAGVAGGIAELWDLDPSLVRVAWVILAFVTAGLAIVVYIVMAIVVPEDLGTPRPPSAPGYGTAAGWAAAPTTLSATPPAPTPGTSEAASGTVPAGPAAMDASPATASSFGPAQADPAGGSGSARPAPGSSAWSDTRRAAREQRHAERSAARAARRAERGHGPGSGAIVGGLILILVGAGVLAGELIPGFDWHAAWPIGLIVIGGILLLGSFRRAPSQP
jgi:phage shock protein PspC (stress-responsive transcriptional regulator)